MLGMRVLVKHALLYERDVVIYWQDNTIQCKNVRETMQCED